MVMCCTAASAPPGFFPLPILMSPMWLTSNTPTLPRTALCSAINPPLDGYSTGMSQPLKLTIFAPRRRCNAFSGVLRSSLMREIVEDSIPIARAETDTNMRFQVGQRSGVAAQRCEACTCRHRTQTSTLPRAPWLRYSFQEGIHGRSYGLRAMRPAGRSLHLREVLHYLQGAAQHPSLRRRPLLLPGLPGSLRRRASR